ncbi:unnamed protein product [Linum tenue]|uniref:Uncharacterized protein n=1 Tax=Linum tenue TaxID=586396 RepID=A0AAV0N1F8_9ROSI|nr:unnamed protein product [Linum tenue]
MLAHSSPFSSWISPTICLKVLFLLTS